MQSEREKFLLFRVYRFKDDKAFGELYIEQLPRIRRFLSHKLPTQQEAEDMATDVFMRVWDYAQTTRVESITGLLFKICRNSCANYYRNRAQVKIQELETIEDTLSDGKSIEEEVSLIMSVEAIEKHLSLLKEEYKDVIIMRFLEEMSVAEISEALEKSENNTRVLLYRAIKAMRRIMDERYDRT